MPALLLDTHVFLWWCQNSRHLHKAARAAIANPGNAVYVSVVSAWEIEIKRTLGKIRLPETGSEDEVGALGTVIDACGFQKLSLEFPHVAGLLDIPRHHRDPFDHMLMAQAMCEGFTLVTHDEAFGLYDVPVLWT